jgi:Electron transfer DM13
MLKTHQNRVKIYIAIIAILFVVLAGIGYFVFKNINEKPALTVAQTSNSSTTEIKAESNKTTVAEARFIDQDAVHKGSGTAKIIETSTGPKLLFEDFATVPGPDLLVYLSPNNASEPLGAFASLGSLKAIKGDQVYDLPQNYKDYKTVVIWCRAFSVTFTTAQLTYN